MKNLLMILCVCLMLLATFGSDAAQVTTVARLNMDGSIDLNSENIDTSETGYVYKTSEYVGDTGGTSTNVTVIADNYGNYPVFAGGAVYLNGGDNNSSQVDEGLIVEVGSGYTPEQNYIWEAWVKPDYANWPTNSNNQYGWITIFRWKEIYDVCDATTNTPTAYHYASSDAFRQRINIVQNEVWSNEILDPNETVPPGVFTHVGVVWEYDPLSQTGTAKYYQNGILKASVSGYISISGTINEFPSTMGVGNIAETNVDTLDALGCGGSLNYNAGYSGWIQSFAFSTFTGSFEGPDEFVLVDPQYCGDIGTRILEADINADCVVNLYDFAELAEKWLWEVSIE